MIELWLYTWSKSYNLINTSEDSLDKTTILKSLSFTIYLPEEFPHLYLTNPSVIKVLTILLTLLDSLYRNIGVTPSKVCPGA